MNLVDTRQLEFDGVFGGHDIRIHGIERRNRGIESVRFARSCWAGDQHHAVGLQNIALKFLERLGFKSELGHVQPEVFLVQQAHDDFFAVQGRDGGNAEVEFLFLAFGLVLDHDAAVLRQALFRDVQFRHNFHTAGDRVFQFQRRIHHGLQLAVNAEPHAHFRFIRLDVNIARAALDRIRQDQIDKLDDRRFVGRLFQRRGVQLRFVGRQLQFFVLGNEVLHQVAEFFAVRGRSAIAARYRLGNRRFGRDDRLHVEARHELYVVHREDVRRVGHRNRQHRAHTRQRHNLIAQRRILWNEANDIGIDFVIFQVDGGHAVLARKHTGDVVIGDEAQFCQAASQLAAVGALKFERLLQLVLRNQAFFN